MLGLSFIMVVFMYPETKYHRPHPDEIVAGHHTAKPSDTPSSSDEKPASKAVENANVPSTEDNAIQHVPTSASTPPNMAGLTLEETAARDPWLGKGSPGKWQWKLFQPNAHPFKSILIDLWIPWKLFAFPIVEFASFVTSWSCSSFLTLNLTQSQAFAAPPYNFSSQSIGTLLHHVLTSLLSSPESPISPAEPSPQAS
jgi:hypothetical protein